MSTLRFTDGVHVNTEGPIRTLKLRDGWYVVGRGMLLPCADREDALATKKELAAEAKGGT